MQRTSPRWFRSRGILGALLLSLSAPWVAGCSSDATPPDTAPSEQKQSQVTLSMGSQDFTEAAKKGRVSAMEFSHNDVKRLRVTVWETSKTSEEPLFVNFDLLQNETTKKWAGTLPFLPKGLALTFYAQAYSDTSATLEIFDGTLDVTLTQDFETLTIPLGPATDKAVIKLPRIERISIPTAFASGQSGNLTFAVSASTGEKLHYTLTPAAGSGTFTPVEGDITLLATTGAFVSLYTPPDSVQDTTVFHHKVTVKNEAGHSVTTTFTTTVQPRETTSGVVDTTVKVLFNPVIQGLDGQRLRDAEGEMTSNVLFTAKVSDDGLPSTLTYAWGFTASGSPLPDPLPAFTGQTNPSTLQNYTSTLQGTLFLEVTDADNGKTTLSYVLTPDQFPDTPVDSGQITGVNMLRAGQNHTCALLNDGALRCWGFNFHGQLGLGESADVGDTEKPSSKLAVKLLDKGSKVALGANHTCALLKSGLVRCWGNGASGQLGYGNTATVGATTDLTKAGYVNLGGLATKITAGGNHTCALMDTNKVRCWGNNFFGQLGYGHNNPIGDDEQPLVQGDVNLGVGVTARDIVAGFNHTCALLDTGRLLCWGRNGAGQLGYAHTTQVSDPSQQTPVNVGDVAQLSAGAYHTCIQTRQGAVKCWGASNQGQLGAVVSTTDANNSSCRDWSPYGCTYRTLAQAATVDLGGTALQIATGYDHTCALLSNGSVKCWGAIQNGRLGLGPNPPPATNVPTRAADLDGSTAYQVTAGDGHTCVLLSTGAARCWGLGSSGQLGYGNKDTVGATNSASAGGNIEITPPTT
ncbi:RTX toxin, partial [Corallococcus sp. CA047B]|uniref:RCC1 domain-containing protein n=1 Tax=Corallococcus sp. CA047B TaxID=2316729 RepID=UPI000EA33401